MITVASFKSYRLKHDLHFIIDSPVRKPDFCCQRPKTSGLETSQVSTGKFAFFRTEFTQHLQVNSIQRGIRCWTKNFTAIALVARRWPQVPTVLVSLLLVSSWQVLVDVFHAKYEQSASNQSNHRVRQLKLLKSFLMNLFLSVAYWTKHGVHLENCGPIRVKLSDQHTG